MQVSGEGVSPRAIPPHLRRQSPARNLTVPSEPRLGSSLRSATSGSGAEDSDEEEEEGSEEENEPVALRVKMSGAGTPALGALSTDELESLAATFVATAEVPSALSEAKVGEYWQKICRRVGITDSTMKDQFKLVWAMHVVCTSTSTSANLHEAITVQGARYPLLSFVNNDTLPIEEYRRFWRARSNVEIAAQVCMLLPIKAVMRATAKRRGINVDCFRVASDICEYFPDVTVAETAEVHRWSVRKYSRNTTQEMSRTTDEQQQQQQAEQPGPPTPRLF